MIEDALAEPRNKESRYAPYRSRPEYRIAGLLDRYRIPFMYEKPTAVMDNGLLRIWYPDFTLSYGLAIEYFGWDDPEYRKRTQHKLAVYRDNQIQVLPTYPQDLKHDWEQRLLHRVDDALDSRLHTYRSRVNSQYRGNAGKSYTGGNHPRSAYR